MWRATAIAAESEYGALCSSDVATRALALEPSRDLSIALIGVLAVADNSQSATVIADLIESQLRSRNPNSVMLESLAFAQLPTPLAGRRSALEERNATLLDQIIQDITDVRVNAMATLVRRVWQARWSERTKPLGCCLSARPTYWLEI